MVHHVQKYNDVNYGPFKRGVDHEINLLVRAKVLGLKDCLLTN
jgi:hypothetical protein